MMYNSNLINNYIKNGVKYNDRSSIYKFVESYKRDLQMNNMISLRPIWVGLKVTSQCNCRCIHCWVEKKKYTPSFSEVCLALNKLKTLNVIHLTITGGEPFLRSDIIEILKEAKKRRFNLEVFTNASLLNGRLIEEMSEIIDKKNDLFQISFDASNEKMFNKQRVNGRYCNVIENIQELVRNKFKVRLNFTVTNINQYDISTSYKLAQKLGVTAFSVSHVYDLNNGKNLYDLVDNDVFEREIEKCFQMEDDSKTEFRPFIPVEYYGSSARRMDESNDVMLCDNIQDWFIHSDGAIYPDVTMEVDEFYLGNIYIDEINEIITNVSRKKELLYKRTLRGTKCEFCSQFKYCRGGEKGRAYQLNGDLNTPDPRCIFLRR